MFKYSAFLLVLLTLCLPAKANTLTFAFTGTTSGAFVSGSNVIPQGTFFSGTLSYNFPQTGTTSPITLGGTQSIYQYNSLTLTIDHQTVVEPAGDLGVYMNPTVPNGIPVGDSLYTLSVFGPPAPASTGSINGITPNYIYLGLVDNSATAFNGTELPQTLNLSSFTVAFMGFNWVPEGKGDSDTINDLTTLTTVPEPPALVLLGSGLALMAFLRLRFVN